LIGILTNPLPSSLRHSALFDLVNFFEVEFQGDIFALFLAITRSIFDSPVADVPRPQMNIQPEVQKIRNF
jgi:hypothetical protein